MIIIENTLVSEELVTTRFCCKLQECLGACCVEGDAGAPLEEEEMTIILEHLEAIKPYMEATGLKTLDKAGFSTHDVLGSLVTTLNEGKECVFTIFRNRIAYCAIERCWSEGKIPFQKPLSCHLYPVRITKYDHYEAVNLHQWHVCASAWKDVPEVPLYQYLQVPLTRKYGEEWFNQLHAAADYVKNGSGK